ncbi:YihY/virulence factor BrkB family protein [Arthrobacter sp. GMC3]|uniref:YihY/virulence factor BrkB family protein n=1 Tax=Arthrobacter sp. GMC3 TaxID=2058894 RepID=UPI000CE46F39|nr:YihY/virulence factor BrkB family protein [Arthrobacter sp. GMC3]
MSSQEKVMADTGSTAEFSGKYVAKRVLAKFGSDGCTDMAATLTYYGILSLFPAILALVSIVGLVGQAEQTTAAMLDLVGRLTDNAVVETIRAPVEQLSRSSAAGWTLALGLVAALWSASGYVGAFSRALNRIYGVTEGRPVWKLRPALLLVTLLAVLIVAAIALLLVISGPIARVLGDALGFGDVTVTVWDIAKWPVVAILAVVLIAVLYHFTPNVKTPKFRWISVGACVALVALTVASAGFGVYVANFSKYEKTYGTIAGMIVLLLWLWIVNLSLLLGAQVDAELERYRELRAGIKAEVQVQLPPRDIEASLKKREKERQLIAEGRELRQNFHSPAPAVAAAAPKLHLLWWAAGAGTALAAVALARRGKKQAFPRRTD